jgi:hypothetical protein
MGYLYTKGNNDFRSFSSDGMKNLAPKLISNNSVVDVVNNFPWTFTPLNSLAIQETPYIRLREFYLLDSFINQAFKAYGKKITSWGDFLTAVGSGLIVDFSSDRLYEGLYDHNDETGFQYILPYFTKNYLQTSNSWISKPFYNEIVKLQQDVIGFTGAASQATGSAFGTALSLLGFAMTMTPAGWAVRVGAALIPVGQFVNLFAPSIAGMATKGAQAGLYMKRLEEQIERSLTSPIGSLGDTDRAIDKPHIWNNTVPRSFNISFPLYNTLTQPNQTKWDEQITKNWEFCYLLTYQNLYNKRNLFTGIPPVFYEIDIPGIHYTKAGYISNLQISNVGNIRTLNLTIDGSTKTVNVPDAYLINFTITDFFMPSKNFMSSLGSKNKGILTKKLDQDTLTSSEEFKEIDPLTGLPKDAFQGGFGGGGIK